MKLTYHRAVGPRVAIAALCVCLGALLPSAAQAQKSHRESRMSAMGKIAHRAVMRATGSIIPAAQRRNSILSGDESHGTGDLDEEEEGGDEEEEDLGLEQDDEMEEIAGGQAETSLAIDSTGQHVVVGFNDSRGFSLAQVSVSGFMYSDDGGLTFTDGGQLPINTVAPTNVAGTLYPQVFGDPEIVYMGGSTFVYASIATTPVTNTTAVPNVTTVAQTMCVHLSTDNGHTWRGPYIIPQATNPHGAFNNTATVKTPRDTADKEFLSRDPETGRLLMSWSNFTPTTFAPGGVEISTTFSDNIVFAAATNTAPTWSARKIIGNRNIDGQSSVPRFAGNGSNDAYVVWRATSGFFTVNESFSVSHDNGATWSAPTNLRSTFFKPMDHVLGNDRTNHSPSMDVDQTGGANSGNIYVVYADDNSNDGADIAFQRSTNGGATWSNPVYVNARPGSDRAQWFPWVNVDQSTGRINVFYYDQGIATAGDLTEVSRTYSDDGGLTWAPPAPITDRPYHAGYGNDTGQPNIGDYNQSVSRLGDFMAVYASNPQSIDFQNGQPSGGMNFPDVAFKRTATLPVALRLGTVNTLDSSGDGNIDPGETLSIQVPLKSYANSAPLYTGVSATLSTTTPGVTVQQASSSYPDVPTLGSSTNTFNYVVKLASGFVPGTSIEFKLDVTTASGNTSLLFTQKTGQALSTVLYSTDFNTDTGGFQVAHGGGTNTVNWGLSSTAFSTGVFSTNPTRALFHQNENDAANPTRWERAIGPVITVPANATYTQVDFDVAYNTEDEPGYNVYAYDGFFLRITDNTGGSFLLRSVLAEAFAQDFTTGGVPGYPKHFPRNTSTAYFEDMSAWAGFSNGWKHVSMKLPGTAGTKIQLRFEYAQDSGGTGHDTNPGYPTSGVAVDNIVVKSVQLIAPPNAAPIANAGADQTVECTGATTPVTLDASASSDPDGEPISFEWFEGTTSLGNSPSITVNAPHHATTTYKVVVTDAHGNSSSDTVDVTVKDTTPPTVTLNGNAVEKIYYGGTFSDPGATATDICDGNVTSSIVVTGTINNLAVGSYTLTYKATDEAGNVGSASRTVKVIYNWSNLLQPVNTDGSSIFKLGSTVPLKFQLLGAASTKSDVIAKVYLAKVSNNVVGSEIEAASTSAADTGNQFRWSTNQYIYNLSTKGLTVGTYQVRVDLGDGELHTLLISLK